MQILQISPSRRSNQVWLKFDDQSLLPLKVDDLVVLKIKKFVDISDEVYNSICTTSAYHLILEYSLRQIAISPKVSSLLRQKLRTYCQRIEQKYNYQPSVLSAQTELVVNKITAMGLLDEFKFIEYLVHHYPKKSTAELNYKLKLLGVDSVIPSNKQDEIDKMIVLLQKKYKNVDFTDFNTKNKLIAKLYHKGFALELIKTAIDEFLKIR